jgi:hypothetical protein
LDSGAALLKGTDAGRAAVVAGDPEKSALIQAVRCEGAVKMPPLERSRGKGARRKAAGSGTNSSRIRPGCA